MKRLHPREREAAALAATGLQDKEIAARMGVELGTVKVHIRLAMSKLGVKRRTILPRIMNMPMQDPPDVELDERDLTIARMLSEGKYMADIAAVLGISVPTTKRHARDLYHRCGVNNATGLASWYLAKFPPAPGVEVVPIGYRFYADHCGRRGEYDASPIWAMNRDDALDTYIRVSTVRPDINVDNRPDAVRFSDGSYRLLTAAEIGAWPEFKQ